MKNFHFAHTAKLGYIAVCLLGIGVTVMSAQNKATEEREASSKSIGFVLSADATEHDLGLPIYPGASRYKKAGDDSSALHMGMWGGGSGFKLVVLKLESNDSPAKVAKYYHKPLSRYGKVVDCGKYVSGESKDNVNCENDHPVEGGYTFEAGTKEKMHVVAVEPSGKGSLISLVYVESPKLGNEKD
jgi:hypothetical protein